MGTSGESLNLQGKLLVAMPGMGDPRFERSVVFICAHSRDETLGLIVNKPTGRLSFHDLLEQLGIAAGKECPNLRVRFGGPVENGRGFVLHSTDFTSGDATLQVNEDFAMTATVDVVEATAYGRGPKRVLLMLGYSGWGEGQLERELLQNGWLTCDATPDLVFDEDDAAKWERALRSLGVDPLTLSAAAGRA